MVIFAKCHHLKTPKVILFSKSLQMLQIVMFVIWPSSIFFICFFNMDVNCRGHEHNVYILIIRSPYGGKFFHFASFFLMFCFVHVFTCCFCDLLNCLHMYNIVNIIILSFSSLSTCPNILDHIKLCKLNVSMVLQILNCSVKLITFLPSLLVK